MYRGLRKQGPGNCEREGAEGALMRAAGSSQEGDSVPQVGTGLVDQLEAPSWLLREETSYQVPAGASGSPETLPGGSQGSWWLRAVEMPPGIGQSWRHPQLRVLGSPLEQKRVSQDSVSLPGLWPGPCS